MPKLLVFKYGKPGQPFGKEATDFATEKLSGKDVRIKLYATDQYNRAVASVQYKDYIFKPLGLGYWKDISEEILKNGLGFVYRQGGGQYGSGGISKWDAIEKLAKNNKSGVWAKGEDAVELPSDYKKAIKSADQQ